MSAGEIFLRLLNNALAAMWPVLTVMAARLLLKRAPVRWLCLLWAVAALRLALPVSVESPVSLVPSAETFPVGQIYSPYRDPAEDVPSWHIDIGFDALNGGTADRLLLPGTAAGNFLRIEALGAVWAAGCALVLLYGLAGYLRMKRRVRAAVPAEPGVKRSENVSSPFVLGVLRPTVYLPLSVRDSDLPLILAHERTHIAGCDHIWKILGFLLLAVYWFFPLFWPAYALFCQDLELACDERVCRDMDQRERRDYCAAMLECAAGRSVFTAPLAFGEIDMKARIERVLNGRKPAKWAAAAVILLAAGLAVFFLTDPVKAGDPPLGKTFSAEAVYAAEVSPDMPEAVTVTPDGSLRLYFDGEAQDVGPLSESSLGRGNFDRRFRGDAGASLRRGNRKAWYLGDWESGSFYYLLWQKSGDVLLVTGWLDEEGLLDPLSDDSGILQVLKLESTQTDVQAGR